MKCLSILVRGRVQGVFYRASTKEVALKFGIRGFVRNEPDGNVYIEAVGDDITPNKFVEWCRSGPPHAKVTEVQVEEKKEPANFHSFEIRRS